MSKGRNVYTFSSNLLLVSQYRRGKKKKERERTPIFEKHMATIVKKKPASVESLPVEIFHRILDNLDVQTILFSFRYVCKKFEAITNAYNKYKLDFSSISKTDFRLICRIIRPKDVITLILSDGEKTPDQIRLFSSIVDIDRWTRLRSLSLLDIDDNDLQTLLLHLTASSSLVSLSIKFRGTESSETLACFSSTISHGTLRQLDFDIYNNRMDQIKWPLNCVLHYLKITDCSLEQFCTILDYSPNLRTFVLRNGISNEINRTVLKPYPQLISLSLNDAHIYKPLSELQTILSLTPSLEYLKVVVLISNRALFDGSGWENIIETHLPHLNKFEFFFSEYNVNNYNSVDVSLRMDRYRTPFWIEMKRWSVVCTYEPIMHRIIVYSIPMCLTSFSCISRFRKTSMGASITIANVQTSLHLLSKTPMTATTEKKVYENTKSVLLFTYL